MRTKDIKVDGKLETCVLVGGGAGFKIYTASADRYLLVCPKVNVIEKSSPHYSLISKYTSLSYQPKANQESIRKDFLALIDSLKPTKAESLLSLVESDFEGEDEDGDWDLGDALKFMKDVGLVPTGNGKPTKPYTGAKYQVAYDPLGIYYLIVYSDTGGSVWMIDDDKGKINFISSFKGKYKPDQGVKIYKNGRERDYLSLKSIQNIFDIVDPSWNKASSPEEQEYLDSLDRKERGH